MPKSKSWDRAYHTWDRAKSESWGMKYKKVQGDKWVIDTSTARGRRRVRPIDLVSRDPDRLREFESKEAAVAFEEESYQAAERLKTVGEDWSQYQYMRRRKLTIPEDQRHLHDSLVGEIRDDNHDVINAVHDRKASYSSLCCTKNNYTDDDVSRIAGFAEAKCNYLVYGKEEGESGTPHLQMYFELKMQMTLRAVNKKLFNSHLEAREGTPKQASGYCCKGECEVAPFEQYHDNPHFTYVGERWGQISQQGARVDLDELRDEIVAGKRTVDDITKERHGGDDVGGKQGALSTGMPSVQFTTAETVIQRDGNPSHLTRVHSFPSSQVQTIVGRAVACDVHLEDRHVSAKHLRICCLGGSRYILTVLSSQGCFLNRERLEKGATRKLNDRDRIRIGKTLTEKVVDMRFQVVRSGLPCVVQGQSMRQLTRDLHADGIWKRRIAPLKSILKKSARTAHGKQDFTDGWRARRPWMQRDGRWNNWWARRLQDLTAHEPVPPEASPQAKAQSQHQQNDIGTVGEQVLQSVGGMADPQHQEVDNPMQLAQTEQLQHDIEEIAQQKPQAATSSAAQDKQPVPKPHGLPAAKTMPNKMQPKQPSAQPPVWMQQSAECAAAKSSAAQDKQPVPEPHGLAAAKTMPNKMQPKQPSAPPPVWMQQSQDEIEVSSDDHWGEWRGDKDAMMDEAVVRDSKAGEAGKTGKADTGGNQGVTEEQKRCSISKQKAEKPSHDPNPQQSKGKSLQKVEEASYNPAPQQTKDKSQLQQQPALDPLDQTQKKRRVLIESQANHDIPDKNADEIDTESETEEMDGGSEPEETDGDLETGDTELHMATREQQQQQQQQQQSLPEANIPLRKLQDQGVIQSSKASQQKPVTDTEHPVEQNRIEPGHDGPQTQADDFHSGATSEQQLQHQQSSQALRTDVKSNGDVAAGVSGLSDLLFDSVPAAPSSDISTPLQSSVPETSANEAELFDLCVDDSDREGTCEAPDAGARSGSALDYDTEAPEHSEAREPEPLNGAGPSSDDADDDQLAEENHDFAKPDAAKADDDCDNACESMNAADEEHGKRGKGSSSVEQEPLETMHGLAESCVHEHEYELLLYLHKLDEVRQRFTELEDKYRRAPSDQSLLLELEKVEREFWAKAQQNRVKQEKVSRWLAVIKKYPELAAPLMAEQAQALSGSTKASSPQHAELQRTPAAPAKPSSSSILEPSFSSADSRTGSVFRAELQQQPPATDAQTCSTDSDSDRSTSRSSRSRRRQGRRSQSSGCRSRSHRRHQSRRQSRRSQSSRRSSDCRSCSRGRPTLDDCAWQGMGDYSRHGLLRDLRLRCERQEKAVSSNQMALAACRIAMENIRAKEDEADVDDYTMQDLLLRCEHHQTEVSSHQMALAACRFAVEASVNTMELNLVTSS